MSSFPLRPSRILRKIANNELATMAKINLADPRVVEIAGLAGVDSVWLCNEHVPNDWLNLENMIRAARLHDVDALVRVTKGSYGDFIRPLEAGAAGIIVPHVASAAEAREIVAMTSFHPIGQRALDNGNVNGAFSRVNVTDYIRFWQREQLVILQIESPEGLGEVEKIAATAGISGLFLGPGDFAHRIGRAGETRSPEVVAARRRVAAAARAAGKFSVTVGFGPPAEVKQEGHSLVAIGADVAAINQFFAARLEPFASMASPAGKNTLVPAGKPA